MKLLGSEGLLDPKPSPDGRYLLAESEGEHRVLLFDLRTERWTEIVHGKLLTNAEWSRDSQYIYFQDLLEPDEPLYRLRRGETQPGRVVTFATLLQAGAHRCGFEALTPDGSPVFRVSLSRPEIYALDLDLP